MNPSSIKKIINKKVTYIVRNDKYRLKYAIRRFSLKRSVSVYYF